MPPRPTRYRARPAPRPTVSGLAGPTTTFVRLVTVDLRSQPVIWTSAEFAACGPAPAGTAGHLWPVTLTAPATVPGLQAWLT